MKTNPKDIDKKNRDDTKRKEQLKFLEKIDNKRIIQNNHVMVGDFDEAINIFDEVV